MPDEDILNFILENNRAVLTLNHQYFVRLHRSNPNHLGIVSCTKDRDRSRMATRMDAEIALPIATFNSCRSSAELNAIASIDLNNSNTPVSTANPLTGVASRFADLLENRYCQLRPYQQTQDNL